ncbi:hypothetical protein MSG28_015030 [Choristoneura fumiferana]|uniref:Uncharacterized protein n=1 Tax=Choristoneura fumiferana TaxID=7141 RepID=A0ACC0KXZ9_CHOFU|nr:hypothetical protein MSG28_015030 [Choristoneura fumiferana]
MLPPRQDPTGKEAEAFLVRFACQRFRNAVWASKKHLKGSGYTLSEFLTSARHAVFVEARRIFGVERSWTSDGRIMVLGQDKTRYRITSLDELRAIPQTRLSDLSGVDWHAIEALPNVDLKLEAFNAALLAIVDMHAPLKPMRVKHNPAPWLTTEIRAMMAKRNGARIKLRCDPSEENRRRYVSLRNRCNKCNLPGCGIGYRPPSGNPPPWDLLGKA